MLLNDVLLIMRSVLSALVHVNTAALWECARCTAQNMNMTLATLGDHMA